MNLFSVYDGLFLFEKNLGFKPSKRKRGKLYNDWHTSLNLGMEKGMEGVSYFRGGSSEYIT